jgi:hypothetical protein
MIFVGTILSVRQLVEDGIHFLQEFKDATDL